HAHRQEAGQPDRAGRGQQDDRLRRDLSLRRRNPPDPHGPAAGRPPAGDRWPGGDPGRVGRRRLRPALTDCIASGQRPAFRRPLLFIPQVPAVRAAPLQWRIVRNPPAAMALNPYDLFDVRSLLSEEERAVQDTVARFTDERVIPIIGDAFDQGRFPKELVPEIAELGLLGSSLPEKYGCAGLNGVSYGLICQELER